MKRMAGSSTAADNKPAVALGRDMLKRPSQRNMTVASAGGDGPMGASVSMSAFSSLMTSSSSSSRRPPRSERFKKPTLNGSFTAFLQNNPKEEVERLTNHIMAAVAKQNQRSDTKNNNKDNETFSPIQQRRRPANRRRSNSITNADLPMNWDGYYKPASSRRNSSKEGGELVQSMKLNAAKLLAELGDIADDSDEDDLQLDFPDTCGEVSYEPVKWDR